MSTVPTRYTLERDVERGQDFDVIEGQLLAEAANVIYSFQHSDATVHVLEAPKARAYERHFWEGPVISRGSRRTVPVVQVHFVIA